jgi:arylsulfatase A-like enzyme
LLLMFCIAPFTAVSSPYFPNLKGKPVREVPLGSPISKPGILLIIIDTLRPDHLSAYGYPKPTSPFIQSLAESGVLFANHFSNSTWTKPSIASLFTGLYPRRHNVLPIASRLSNNIMTIAQAFKEAGFKTGAVVANNFSGRRYGLDRGFDRFAEPSNYFRDHSPTAEQVTKLALKWISEDKDQPFFYTLFLFDPHDPYAPPPNYCKAFCPGCTPPEITVPLREYHGPGPTAKQISDMKGLFDGEIAYADDTLKTFFESLNKMGLTDRISTVLVGDHGEAFGEHRVFEHAFHIWDEVIRTPLIIHSPRVSARGVYTGLTQHVDVFPTLMKLAGLNRPAGLQGTSLVQSPGEQPPSPTRLVVSEVQMYGIHRAQIRDYRYKLIRHDPLDETEFRHYYQDTRTYPSVILGGVKQELYNVSIDPLEQKDVYQSELSKVPNLPLMLERYLQTGSLEEDSQAPVPSEEDLKNLKALGYLQ